MEAIRRQPRDRLRQNCLTRDHLALLSSGPHKSLRVNPVDSPGALSLSRCLLSRLLLQRTLSQAGLPCCGPQAAAELAGGQKALGPVAHLKSLPGFPQPGCALPVAYLCRLGQSP